MNNNFTKGQKVTNNYGEKLVVVFVDGLRVAARGERGGVKEYHPTKLYATR